MKIREALQHGRAQLHPISPSPALDARLLLQHVLQKPHTFLIAHGDETLTAVQQQQYRRLLHRARQKEPIPYLTGRAPFYGLDFHVTPAVLIPRPETEQLVEHAIRRAKPRPHPRIVDVGTGSGCIPITLARHLPHANITATDISPDALAVARRNAEALAPGRIQFYQGDLLSPVTHAIDLITANLPYVTDHEWTMLDDGVKLYEPATALKGGPDGLDLIRKLLQQAVDKLRKDGAILLEIGWQQGPSARRLAKKIFPTAHIHIISDLAGHDRVIMIEREHRGTASEQVNATNA